MKVVGLIPSRLKSSRLPGKPLKNICGLPMIVHVYKRCLLSELLDDVFVVTDSNQIKSAVESFDGEVIMSSKEHQTGTDRIAEAAKNISADIIVNIQGDEALVVPSHIDKVTKALINDPKLNIAILVNTFYKKDSLSDIKVVLNNRSEVLYLSRSDIPNDYHNKNQEMLKAYHIVPFRKKFLLEYTKMPKSFLELIENNEYLRILENGYNIKAVKVNSSAISVDTYDDLEIVRKLMIADKYFNLYS